MIRLRLLGILVPIALLAALVAANWQVFLTPARLSLVFAAVELPFGLAMLVLIALVSLAFVAYMAAWRAGDLIEARRHAEELRQLRKLADAAEASRIDGLQSRMTDEFGALREAFAREAGQLRGEIRDNGNALAAQVAELDDRLRAAPSR